MLTLFPFTNYQNKDYTYTMVRYSVEPSPKRLPSLVVPTSCVISALREIASPRHEYGKRHQGFDDVLAFKAVIPFVRYTGGIGRKAMAKQIKAPGSIGRWPVKATAVYKDLLKNAVANAETKGLDPEILVISHAQCNRAPAGRRRTYRAHGRIGKYASQPAHIEIIVTEKSEPVEKMDDGEPKKITKKAAARNRFVKVGAA
jgi:large subunit ribosomal protein L17e